MHDLFRRSAQQYPALSISIPVYADLRCNFPPLARRRLVRLGHETSPQMFVCGKWVPKSCIFTGCQNCAPLLALSTIPLGGFHQCSAPIFGLQLRPGQSNASPPFTTAPAAGDLRRNQKSLAKMLYVSPEEKVVKSRSTHLATHLDFTRYIRGAYRLSRLAICNRTMNSPTQMPRQE